MDYSKQLHCDNDCPNCLNNDFCHCAIECKCCGTIYDSRAGQCPSCGIREDDPSYEYQKERGFCDFCLREERPCKERGWCTSRI